jgi:bla regulator protein BlaR1
MRLPLRTICFSSIALCYGALAQEALPKFEVASIRVNGNPPGRFIVPLPGGKISCTGDSLKDLIGMAWGVSPDEVLGGPAWADSIRYNILAKPEDGATQGMSINQIGQYNRLMMRSLLIERFHVAVHLETREAPIYALVIARKDGKLGPGLKEPKVGQCAQLELKPLVLPEDGTFPELMCGAGLLIFKGTARGAQSEIKSLISPLSRVVGRRVVDETGLKQRFDVEMQWSNNLVPSDNQPSIFIAIEEQLGLKLEPRKGPVDFIVIDHADKVSEN